MSSFFSPSGPAYGARDDENGAEAGQWAERRGIYAAVPNSDGAMQEASWKTT